MRLYRPRKGFVVRSLTDREEITRCEETAAEWLLYHLTSVNVHWTRTGSAETVNRWHELRLRLLGAKKEK